LKPRPALLIPAICKVMDGASPEAMNHILEAVEPVGARAAPVLVKALEDAALRPRVAAMLGRLGPDAREAAPALAGIVERDPSPAARREALIALGAMGPFAAEQAPIIAKVLKDDDFRLRAAACYALGKIGPPSIASKDELLECRDSGNELCGAAAAWALSRVDPQRPAGDSPSVACLVKDLFDPDAHVRLKSVNALRDLGAQAQEALPALKKIAADDPQAALRIAADEAVKTVNK
jgi:HEAT repeat protein